ncbi:hypothetical protein EAG21025_18810 [Enterobacter asburiae]|uniref:hypothetical protein n=1 Tax=Enterobacter asburiae TaxID=61645 RepID=UPI0034E8E909|nr:hypothetical protein [Enterobacter asburiae]
MKQLFSRLPEELLHSHLGKFRFGSFDDIPKDDEPFVYPKFSDIRFILPPVFAQEGGCIIFADGLKILESMGDEAFNIDPIRWHKVKSYIANGMVEYPEMTSPFRIMDGRHRTLALTQLYPGIKIPVIVPHSLHSEVIETGIFNKAIVEPML